MVFSLARWKWAPVLYARAAADARADLETFLVGAD